GLDREHLSDLDRRGVAQELVLRARRAGLHPDVVHGDAERVAEPVREQRTRDAAIDELRGPALADADLAQHIADEPVALLAARTAPQSRWLSSCSSSYCIPGLIFAQMSCWALSRRATRSPNRFAPALVPRTYVRVMSLP